MQMQFRIVCYMEALYIKFVTMEKQKGLWDTLSKELKASCPDKLQDYARLEHFFMTNSVNV